MKNKYINILVIALICVLFNADCSGKSKKSAPIIYDATLKENVVLYGVDINKLLDSKFSDIGKKFNCSAVVDSEMSVVFVHIEKDFMNKKYSTAVVDHISITYGSIEDLNIYNTYPDIKPLTIAFYGSFKDNEPVKIKDIIIKELQGILTDNNNTRNIINAVRKNIIEGVYKEDLIYNINFKTPKFQFAKLYIGFANGELFYKYVFSKVKEPYPTP